MPFFAAILHELDLAPAIDVGYRRLDLGGRLVRHHAKVTPIVTVTIPSAFLPEQRRPDGRLIRPDRQQDYRHSQQANDGVFSLKRGHGARVRKHLPGVKA